MMPSLDEKSVAVLVSHLCCGAQSVSWCVKKNPLRGDMVTRNDVKLGKQKKVGENFPNMPC